MEITRRTAVGSVAVGSIMLLMPRSALAQLARTPNVGLGPFYPVAKPAEADNDLSLFRNGRAAGQLIEVTGRVLDLRGNPIPGARLDIWQANAAGRYTHPADTNTAPLDPNFQGFAQLRTDRLGHYRVVSIKPGPYADPVVGLRPPHIHLDVRSRQSRLVTQMLFPGEPLNQRDRITAHANQAALTAGELGTREDGAQRFGWDIILDLG